MASATTNAPSFIAPERLYTHRGMIIATGLSQTRIREASRECVNCRRMWVGKRCFYRGSDIIMYIEQLAALDIKRDTTYLETEE